MGLYRGCQPGSTSQGWDRGEPAQTCAVSAAAACWVTVETADVERWVWGRCGRAGLGFRAPGLVLILRVKKGIGTRSSPRPPKHPRLPLQPRPACQECAGEDFQVRSEPEQITNHLCLVQEEKKWWLSYKLFTGQ